MKTAKAMAAVLAALAVLACPVRAEAPTKETPEIDFGWIQEFVRDKREIEIHDAHEIKAAFERRPAPDLSWLRKTERT